MLPFSGEGKDVTREMTDPWKETTLKTILTNYVKTDIYNCTAHPEIGGLKAIDLFFLPPKHDLCPTANGPRGHPLLKSQKQNKSGPKSDRSD